MTNPFVDTDVIIRLLAADDLEKQAEAAALFERVQAGELRLLAPDTVIADAVYVLSSARLYKLPRAKVQELLSPLVRLPGFEVQNRHALLSALDLFVTTNLGFGDALIVASMKLAGSEAVYSYDSHFDRVPGVVRLGPSVADLGSWQA
ncbi:MAG: PIN domain-containing protein [Dehalococcoidia bacterium]|nr:PIN domain-containing protein [Dehalococcoidia bacterium]